MRLDAIFATSSWFFGSWYQRVMPKHVLHEVDHCGAILVDEGFARGPDDHLRDAEGLALLKQDLSFLLKLSD